MACRIIVSPLTGKEVESKTWNDINDLVLNEQEADKLYRQLTSDQFISWFGNWIGEQNSILGRVNEIGEPLVENGLFENSKGETKSVFNKGSYLSSDNPVDIEKKPAELFYNGSGTPFQLEISKDGRRIGDIHVAQEGENLRVYDTMLKEKGNNLGTYSYLQVAKYAKDNNLTFTSDNLEDVSPAAKKLWDRFVNTGQAELKGNNYVFTGDPNKVTSNIYYDLQDTNPNVNFGLKILNILQSKKAEEIFAKGEKSNWDVTKILNELGVSKQQQELIDKSYLNILNQARIGNLKNFNIREEIITNLLANYSYTVEINTTKGLKNNTQSDRFENFLNDGGVWININTWKNANSEELEYIKNNKRNENEYSNYYSNLTVPGGTNYTENEIATPAITPSIKGHAQFSTPQGIGWFRSDESQQNQETDIQSVINNLEKSGQLEINCK